MKNTCKTRRLKVLFPSGLKQNPMKTSLFSWQNLCSRFLECIRDDRGVAMTEYLLITGIMVPAVIYLFHPDNGFYSAERFQYNLTTLVLTLPGP